ncbi:hypothetical protein BV22DRAFT_1131921 [Leucogyrophana mollusca]|uniref:Uncharacterized protein n=1 Tax=Leucogyrophana mollusca TaxID=85980 RepID=A0ACB8B7V2_9AGAM|nr:hypothetical protein BV22DRAFT_1131921 [Leucogyrophana mollusca]
MGKSRVVDQIGKTHFVIPMNLRLGARGFVYFFSAIVLPLLIVVFLHCPGYPPADEQVPGYLSQTQDQFQTFLRTCGFLSALFIETRLVIVNDSKAIKRPSHLPAIDPNCEYEELAAQFHDYMTDGMTISSHGPFRKMFYQAVVDRAVQESTPACHDFYRKHGTDLNADQSHAIVSPSRTDVNKFPRNDALEQLIKAVQSFSAPPCSPTIQRSSTAREKVEEDPLVMLAFDDAHALTLGKPNRVWSNFTELRRSLRGVNKLRIFSVFLSTTGEIIQFTPPKDLDRSSLRIVLGELALIEPYCDLGFDQLAAKLTFSGGEVRKIDEFTNDKCISHFGRPLFGSRYDYGEEEIKSTIVEFAAAKLLGGHEYTGATNLTNSQKLACLSQRLPIEFISTTYAHYAEEMKQVEGHMRVCLRVSPRFESMMTVSPSEPLLSEAAYWVMQNKHFDPPRTLQTVLEGFSIHKGDRGELLVMLLLTLARDAAVGPPVDRGKPVQRWTTVPDFFSNLFSARTEAPLRPAQPPASAQNEIPTAPGHVVGPGGVGTSKITFEERFRDARVYFNHTIKVHQQSFLTTPHLAALFYRGAAVLCGNNQPAIDGIIPICMGEELKPEHMGAILWQSKNDPAYTSDPKTSLFDSMDPFSLNIFRDNDTHTTSARAPLIRIVFALAAKKPSLKLVKVSESARAAFTTYDIWCAGLSPHILAPIDSGQTDVWNSLLEATYGWREIYKSDPKNFGRMDIRRNSNPGAAEDAGHWSWFADA